MEFHRTEKLAAPTGLVVPVTVAAAGRYDGDLRETVRDLKYGGKTLVAKLLAEMLSDLAGECLAGRTASQGSLSVTWAPTSDARRRSRGYDQAELIARHFAALTGLHHRRLLRRISRGHQTGSTRKERLDGPSFVARAVRAQMVIVVDDVMTTGATLRAATRALVVAGATEVVCLAVAHTPERSGSAEGDATSFGDGVGRILADVDAMNTERTGRDDVCLEVV
ncbi:MAG: ComF family protein, partial [Ilumatobacteraceae bacterium]